jgi:hypothetical protein
MTTVSLGFTRGADLVGMKGLPGWLDKATHWQYRAGVTQVLSAALAGEPERRGHGRQRLPGQPLPSARVFGAFVHENNPRTRSSRALKLRSITDTHALVADSSLRAEYRYYWDNWDIRAHTTEVGASKNCPAACCWTRGCASIRRARRCSTATTPPPKRCTSAATASSAASPAPRCRHG